jgi:ATP-dependent DNA helicase
VHKYSRVSAPNQSQQAVLDAGLLATGFDWVLQLPTGSGKTWLAELAIEQTLQAGQRAVYLTPLRALATELLCRWTERFADHRVGVFTGEFDERHKHPPVPYRDAELLIMTPERLDACTRFWRTHWDWIPCVDLLVVDEFHLLGDPARGPRLEGTLSRFRRLNPLVRMLALSATLGNRGELADWLGAAEFANTWRPIPLVWRTVTFKRATDKPNLLLEAVRGCIAEGGQSLVFVQSRRRAEQLSHFLRENGLPTAHHHAGLDRAGRLRVEDGIRSGAVRAAVATGTLEMGLNLPVRQVVLYDLQGFDGRDFKPLPVTTVWQRAGRAGRPGLDTHGEVVLLRPFWDRAPDTYARGQFEPVRSGLCSEAALAEQILAEIGSGLARTQAQVTRVFARSLAARQSTLPSIDRVLSTMRAAGMVGDRAPSEDKSLELGLRVTPLGRIAVRQMLMPETVLMLRTATKLDSCEFTFLDMLLLACATPDCQPLIPADFEELDDLSATLARERSAMLQGGLDSARPWLKADGRRFLAVIKTAVIAREWTRTGDTDAVAERWNCYPFEVRRLCDTLTRILTALSAVMRVEEKKRAESEEVVVVDPNQKPSATERIRALIGMVQHGLNEETVTLTFIPGIGGTHARRLVEAGIRDVEDLALADVATCDSIKGVSQLRLDRWVGAAIDLVKRRSAKSLQEVGPHLVTKPHEWPTGVDPYRLRRAAELRVEAAKDGRRVVTGGLEPHQVVLQPEAEPSCDCADFARGNVCKHVLAVLLYHHDRGVSGLLRRLRREDRADTAIDLFALWSANRS